MAASGKRQAPGEDSLGTNEVDDVRRAVKRLRTGDEPLPVGLPVLDAGLQLQALNGACARSTRPQQSPSHTQTPAAPPAPLASAQPVAPTQQPVKEQHAAPQWSMRGSQQSLDDVSPTRCALRARASPPYIWR